MFQCGFYFGSHLVRLTTAHIFQLYIVLLNFEEFVNLLTHLWENLLLYESLRKRTKWSVKGFSISESSRTSLPRNRWKKKIQQSDNKKQIWKTSWATYNSAVFWLDINAKIYLKICRIRKNHPKKYYKQHFIIIESRNVNSSFGQQRLNMLICVCVYFGFMNLK